jgi:hypothetical protein
MKNEANKPTTELEKVEKLKMEILLLNAFRKWLENNGTIEVETSETYVLEFLKINPKRLQKEKDEQAKASGQC